MGIPGAELYFLWLGMILPNSRSIGLTLESLEVSVPRYDLKMKCMIFISQFGYLIDDRLLGLAMLHVM